MNKINDKKQNKEPILIRVSSEMSNWMHPDSEERKIKVKKRVEDAKERYSKRKKTKE